MTAPVAAGPPPPPPGPGPEGWGPLGVEASVASAAPVAPAGGRPGGGADGPVAGGRRVVLVALLVGALAALGGAGFTTAFAVADLARPVALGAVGGAGGSLLVTGLLRRRLALATPATVAILAPLALLATGGGPDDIVTGLTDGARLILTSAVPMAPRPEALVVPYVVTAAVAFAGTEAGLRARNAAAPVLPPLVALVVGLAFNLEGGRPATWVLPAWLVVAALVVAARRPRPAAARAPAPAAPGAPGSAAAGPGGPGGGGSTRSTGDAARRLVALVPVVAVVVAAAPAVGERLPGADRRAPFTLRDLVEQPARPESAANPLVLVTAWQDGPDDPLFAAEVAAPGGVDDPWRLAVLDAYDGVEWASGASFVPVGEQLPEPADEPGDGGTEVTQAVEPLALEGPWLPSVGRPATADAGEDLLFDTGGGVLVAQDGVLPERYEATSVVGRPRSADLQAARAATDDEADRALDLPDSVPDELRRAADEITGGAATDYMKATELERFLSQPSGATPFRLATEALPSGHSVGHLRCFLLAPDRCGRQGSTEQFVAAYAVLARAAGLPTRIVVGFAASGTGRGEVTAHDATAWPEVRFDGVGWVRFDPVPQPDVTTLPPPPDVAGGGGAPETPTDTTPAEADEDADDAAAGEELLEAEPAEDSRLPLYAGVAALVTLVLAVPALVRGRRRRRRRRAPTPGERVAGAWAEAMDGLAAAGAAPPPSGSVTDLVLAGRTTLPELAEPLAPLGDLVNRTRFARGEATDADAEAAWHLSDAFTAARRRSRTVPQRLREYASLRAPARNRT